MSDHEQNIAGAPQRDPVNGTTFPIGGSSPGSTSWARMKSVMQVAMEAIFAVWSSGTDAPAGGRDGQWYLRHGNDSPGIYRRSGGAWARLFSGGGDGTDATARAAAAANRARLDAIPVYAGRLAVWPPNVRRNSDFQRTFQSTLSGLVGTLATDGGSTGTRFANVFNILTRIADGTVVQLHTQGWSATNDERQTIEWEVSAAEFNQLGTEVTSNGLEVWGEFRAVYGGGVNELRGRTTPVFIDFGEQDGWPATRGEIPEQRVLQDVAVPSAATRGKLVINDDLAYVTRAERDVTTPADAEFEDFAATDYVGDFDDDNVPDSSANIGRWYWNTTRLTAFRAFRDNGGAVWTETDVNRLVTGGDYRGAWGTDKEAIPHIQQVGDFYYLYFNAMRRARTYTPPVRTHLRDEYRRLATKRETDRRLEFIVQGSPSQIDKNNVPSAFNFLLTHKAGAFPEAATARIDFFGRQVLYPNYQPSIGSRSLGWGVDDADRLRIATLTEGRSEDAVVRLLDSSDVEIPGTASQVDFTVVEGATGGGGGGTTDSTARAAAAAAQSSANSNATAISSLRTESRSGDDLQSITVASLASLNSALTAQATAATALEIVFSADVTKDGTTYSNGDVVYVAPRSTAPEGRFNILQGGSGVDQTARNAAAAAQSTADGKADAFTLSSADLRFAGQRVLGLSTARTAQLNRTPADGGTARQVWSKGPANEKAAWRDPTSGSAAGEADSDISGALNLPAASSFGTLPITEDIEPTRWYRYLYRVGSTNRYMFSSAWRGSEFLALGLTSGASFAQGSAAELLAVTCPRPDADGVRTFFMARTSNARQILVRVENDYNVIKLIKLGGIPGPKGEPGTAELNQAQQIALLGLIPRPAVISFETAAEFESAVRDIRIGVPNPEILTGDVWVEGRTQGQPSLARTKWSSTTSELRLTLGQSVAETISKDEIQLEVRLRIYDASTGGNEIERIGVNIPIVDLRSAGSADQTARNAAAAAQTTADTAISRADAARTVADAATTPTEATNIANTRAAARFTDAEKAKLANLYRDDAPASAATINWNVDNNEVLTLAARQNFTLNMSGGVSGQIATLRVLQDSTGSRTMTFGTGIVRDGRAAPVLSTAAGAHDNIFFQKRGALWVYLIAIPNNGLLLGGGGKLLQKVVSSRSSELRLPTSAQDVLSVTLSDVKSTSKILVTFTAGRKTGRPSLQFRRGSIDLASPVIVDATIPLMFLEETGQSGSVTYTVRGRNGSLFGLGGGGLLTAEEISQ